MQFTPLSWETVTNFTQHPLGIIFFILKDVVVSIIIYLIIAGNTHVGSSKRSMLSNPHSYLIPLICWVLNIGVSLLMIFPIWTRI